jgi:uncharacterized protein (DUF1800 family)
MEFVFWFQCIVGEVIWRRPVATEQRPPREETLRAIFSEARYKALEELEGDLKFYIKDQEDFSFQQCVDMAWRDAHKTRRNLALQAFLRVLQAHPKTQSHPCTKIVLRNLRPNPSLDTDEKVRKFLENVEP